MKKVGIIVTALACVGLVCGIFYFVYQKNQPSADENAELTEVQKLITKDLDAKYPATPREVVKLYNRIVKSFYSKDYTDEELDKLADQALFLFDDELAANNPKDTYVTSVKADADTYEKESKTISQFNVCDSNDVLYKTVDGDDVAYVSTSYFIKDDKNYEKTYQTFVLRKDKDERWKILVFYQTEAPKTEED